MTNKKLCPLKKLPNGMFGYCDKEKCAWYDQKDEMCALLLIEIHLYYIREWLWKISRAIEK